MEKLLKRLIDRVEVLIKLQVIFGLKDYNKSDRIMALHDVGIAQADIASILGVKLNNVTSTVSQKLKRRDKRKRKGSTDEQ